MGDMEFQKAIQSIMDDLNKIKETEGRSEKSRLLAVAVTHLETAKLFIKETEIK